MAGRALPETPPRIGDVVICRYVDAVLFKDGEASAFQPWIRQMVGWLDFIDHSFLRVVWERTAVPTSQDARTLSSGLTIPRKNVVELRKVG